MPNQELNETRRCRVAYIILVLRMASISYSLFSQNSLAARTTLFQRKDEKIYRIPALIYINDCKTFLAFAEERSSPRDSDAKVLVMRRGTEQNGSIQTLTFELDNYDYFQWSPAQTLSSACLPDHRSMNPCPVYERNSKTIYLFFVCILGNVTESEQIFTGKNQARLCYITSTDYGLDWSTVTDLTNTVIGDEIVNWATFAVGPGHGIQMKNGRLIIPAYVYYIHCKCFPFNWPISVWPNALSFYSDDCGITWHMGEKLQKKSCECQMAEIIDNDNQIHLYCNARSTCGYRVEALSESSGEAFDKPHAARKLVEYQSCQGSVLSFPFSELANETWLLYSHPTNKMRRMDLGVYLNKSPLNSSSWSQPMIIHKGPSGYSDLTRYNNRFACLMECGEKSEHEEIAFMEFPLDELL
ncbi:hypothetical protein DNTS_034133 [Danionella cerebrum]|uniref:exo-alpha-sialidase n=1 Tax=Danionella cerebrum TaxID=2873325 RepID=A0A553R6U5_9TELE|nr:hypothetical protein DNTS_034133 [Danionella translucida]